MYWNSNDQVTDWHRILFRVKCCSESMQQCKSNPRIPLAAPFWTRGTIYRCKNSSQSQNAIKTRSLYTYLRLNANMYQFMTRYSHNC